VYGSQVHRGMHEYFDVAWDDCCRFNQHDDARWHCRTPTSRRTPQSRPGASRWQGLSTPRQQTRLVRDRAYRAEASCVG
jgi:hypothetical protein